MPTPLKSLSLAAIESSTEIGSWLSQFPAEREVAAKSLLIHLKFVTRDDYSNWLRGALQSFPANEPSAIYAVRKFPDSQDCLWDDAGNVVNRPGTALGSEDLVYSLIANVVRANDAHFFDHPPLSTLKKNKIHDIVLVDDSIGSGKRVSDFIKSMTAHSTFKSWWSFGFITFHVLAFARTRESEKTITDKIPGSDHPKRKYPVSSKIRFVSEIVYSKKLLSSRWGRQYQVILDLCDSSMAIGKKWRRGFGGVLSNLLFFHSVPNNIPGVLFDSGKGGKGWRPLFPGRSVPDSLIPLIDHFHSSVEMRAGTDPTQKYRVLLSDDMLRLLSLIKSGVRRTSNLALRMDRDIEFLAAMLVNAKESGLVSNNVRLTEAGIKTLRHQTGEVISRRSRLEKEGRALYIPKSWCTDQVTVQSACSGSVDSLEQADLAKDVFLAGGEAGQVSLERSDAKAAPPPLNVGSQPPSESRKGPDIHGPLDSKDR
jgi:hypothetical protein